MVFVIVALLVVDEGCGRSPSIDPTSTVPRTLAIEEYTLPTPVQQLDTLIQNMSSDDAGVRLVSIRALANFGDEAVRAIPALRLALLDTEYIIRENAAIQIGNLGPKAEEAVPDLIRVLEDNNASNLRRRAARALGQIGSPISVPVLARTLYSDDQLLEIEAAEAIAELTGVSFRDSGYHVGYRSDNQETPNIVLDARKWWEEIGQYQEWTD